MRHWPARQSHCRLGHRFDADNTRWRMDRRRQQPRRFCRTCQLMYHAEYAQRRRDQERKAA